MKYIFKIGLSLFAIMMMVQVSSAQTLNTYNVPGLIQRVSQNPAYIPDCDIHFGTPFLSNSYVQVNTSGFRYHDLVQLNSNDSLNVSMNDAVSKMKKKNMLGGNAVEEYLSYGMKFGDIYVNANVTDRAEAYVKYEKDPIDMLVNGNMAYAGTKVELLKTSAKAYYYREYSVGAAYDELIPNWTFGAKAKLLFGKDVFYAPQVEGYFLTDENTYDIEASMNIDYYTAGAPSGATLSNHMFSGKNLGFAMDFGATWEMNSEINLSASVLDLGFIKWKENAVGTFTSNPNQVVYQGMDIMDFIGNDMSVQDRIDHLGDSLLNGFGTYSSDGAFTTMLTTKIILGGTYEWDGIGLIGATLKNEIYKGRWIPSFAATYHRELLDYLTVFGSYTISSRGYFNIGGGAVFTMAPVQIFISTENIVGTFAADQFRYANLYFGVNWFLGGGGGAIMMR